MDDPNRRQFLETVMVGAFATALSPGRSRAETATSAAAAPPPVPAKMPVALDVNGRTATLSLDPRTTLLDALRESMHLTGTKKGCDHGQCGACTVHINGRRVLSCLTLAAMAQGQKITTIEGLAHGETLHPMQQAFIDHDGFQCGYCTPGQIMSAAALLTEPCGLTDDDVRECMSGNICRCGAYPNIVAAVQAVRAHSTR
jgi:xanthine dehydrogenase YagT iron-sulfur-binding subunit